MKKISETFLDFAEPLLQGMGDPAPESGAFRTALKLAHLVWNAAVLAEKQQGHDYLGDVRRELQGRPESLLVEAMIEDKKRRFSTDLWLIGNYEIRRKPDGSYSVWAEARGDKVH